MSVTKELFSQSLIRSGNMLGDVMFSLLFIFAIISGLIVTYPLNKVIRYFVNKIEMSKKSKPNLIFVLSLLIVIIFLIPIYGLTLQFVNILLAWTASLLYWFYLNRADKESKYIKFINNKKFRIIFGVLLTLIIFTLTINLFKWFDPYYITPLLLTIFYMVFIYKRPRRKKVKEQTIQA